MAICNSVQNIAASECIGDSLVKINSNFSNLNEDACTLLTLLNQLSASVPPVGSVIQTLFASSTNTSSTTNPFPFSTKPQYNASNIILTQAITVQSASNKVLIQGQISGGKITGTGQQDYVVALFNTESGDAIAAQLYYSQNTGNTFNFDYLHSPGSAGTFTYRLGLGGTDAGTVFFNKRFSSADSDLGGLHMSSMLVQEIKG